MPPFSSLCLWLVPLCSFLVRVQTSVISDHFKNKAQEEQVVGQPVEQSLETQDDMMQELNGGALTDFFHSYSVLEDDDKVIIEESEGGENSDLIHVEDFLNLTSHDLPSPRSILPKFKGNLQVVDDVPKAEEEDSGEYHEHPSVDFLADVLKNKLNEATVTSSTVPTSSPGSAVVKESSQTADSSLISESSDFVTSPVLPSSKPSLPPTLESSSDSTPTPVFSPPSLSLPSSEGEPSPDSSTLQSSPKEPSTTEVFTTESSTTNASRTNASRTELSTTESSTTESLTKESSTTESPTTVSPPTVSSSPVVAGVDSLDSLFMELENLNNLNEAVQALNQGPYGDAKAEDRTDVIDDGYGADDEDEADDIFSTLFSLFG